MPGVCNKKGTIMEEPTKASQALHRARELRLWGGTGGDANCDHCCRPIEAAQTDYEVEAELDGAQITFHFHRTCYDRWKARRRECVAA